MFVQVISGRCEDPPKLHERLDVWASDVRPGAHGFLGSTAGVTDDGAVVVIARFEDQALAQKNSNRPEQSQWWADTEPHIKDASFVDSTEIDEFLGGGSDDAGFVQVIRGRAVDRKVLMDAMSSQEDALREGRSDVLGGIIAWHGDGNDFIQAVYFTSEEAAREGERSDTSEEMGSQMQDLFEGDLDYIDLREPLLLS